jgi:hypothetical protein
MQVEDLAMHAIVSAYMFASRRGKTSKCCGSVFPALVGTARAAMTVNSYVTATRQRLLRKHTYSRGPRISGLLNEVACVCVFLV